MMRAAATAGIFCPTLFVATLAALTALQHDFMLGISWRPLRDPAGAWPSGLALGLRRGMKDGSRIGHTLLLVAGVAMALMAFETDPIRRTGPRTWHGWIHDVAFVVFALALLGALFFLWRGFRRDPRWRSHARYTLITGDCATFLLLLPGVAYYLFLAVVLVWFEVTAFRLWPVPSSPRT